MVTSFLYKNPSFEENLLRIMNKEDLQKQLGEQILKLMKLKKVSHKQLSNKTEIEPPHITRLLKGGTNPTFFTLVKIADALEIDLEKLVHGLPNKKKGK